ncbi:hypothetical protein CBL_10730 [Carabus blaptoides fortunei]
MPSTESRSRSDGQPAISHHPSRSLLIQTAFPCYTVSHPCTLHQLMVRGVLARKYNMMYYLCLEADKFLEYRSVVTSSDRRLLLGVMRRRALVRVHLTCPAYGRRR